MSTGKLPVPSLLRNLFVCIILLLGTNELVYAQMREIYASPLAEVGPVKRIDFFSPKEGFVAFTDGIGFSNDTAHSFRYFNYITSANVDFAYWGINAASKFFINGVKAFDNNTILVYGNYPNAPAILRSTDGGKNFTIVLATVNWSGSPGKGGVTDMVNLKDRSITLAVDADHIYRSASKGLSWDTLQVIPDAHFTNIDGFDNGHVYAWSTTHPQQFIYRSGTDGSGFVPISIRGGTLRAASFINANEGYISVDGVSAPGLYYTRDAGQNWISTLAAGETPIAFRQLKFADAATGYGIANRYDTYQTIDSGKTWQKISRTGFFGSPPQDVHLNTISTYDGNQLWTGGENSLIELNTAMSKTLPPPAPVQPVSLFTIDTTGFHAGLPVKLKSLSEPGLTLQWFVNDKPVGIAAITTYIPGVGRNIDTIKLVVARDLLSDTSIQYQHYPVIVPPVDPPPVQPPPALPAIISVNPLRSFEGGTVDINGSNFKNVTAVSFGGVPAASFTVRSESLITAVIGTGASGNVMVQTVNGAATLESFDFVQKPALASFTPDSAGTDQTVVIRGNNLATTSQVLFGNIPAHAFTIISDTEIHAKPGEGSTGHLKIITLAGEYSLPGFRFKPAPKIFSVTPDSGIAGAPVSIRGEHFIGTTSVYIGSGKVSSFTVISDSIIIAIIEEGHNGYVHVTNQFGTSGVAPFFTYTFVPVIRSFSPKVGGEGTRMKIEVENAYVVDSIKIGGVPVRERLPLAFQQIEVVVGKGATGKISLQTGGKIVLSSDSFEYVEKPVLKSFTPSTGKIGTIVTVTGAQFHNTAKVYFGGAMASQVNVLSDTVLTAIVSNGASGDLRLETAGGKISLPGFVFIQSLKPKLNSFAPLSGKAGTLVTISGENFNPDPASNFVRFGASYGKVIIASTTELKVEAPAGASAGILEVTTNGYSMLANNFFTLESAQKRELKDTTFTWRKTLMPAKNAPGLPIGSGDLDGDGKADLVLFSGTDECKVYLNTSNNDSISFSEAIKITAFSSLRSILLHDMDQDGRVDLIGGSGSAIKILKNTSRPGKISFDNPVERTGGRYSYFRATDVNGDGKPEIIGLGESGDVYIFRNTSSGSTMSFGSFYRFPYGPNNYQFEMADLSGDGKPDLITADNNVTYPERSMVIFQNTSTEDTISFSQSMTFNGGGAPNRFIPGDYNHDNRIDLIIHHYDGVQYVENTSANGIISFAPITRIFTNTSTNYSDIGDLNGDGLVDLVVQKSLDSALYIYSQNFSNNIVSFVPVAQSPARATVKHFVMRDLNNNGSPEMLVIGGDEQLHLFSADVVIPIADTCRLIANIGMSRDSSCAGNQTVYSAFASGTFTNPTYAWYINGILHPFMGATFKDPALRAGDKVNVVIRANTPCGVRADTSIIFTNTYVILKPTARITGITKVKGGQTTVLKVEIRNSFHTTGYQWQDSTSTHSWKTIANANLQLLMYKPAVSGDKLRSIVVSSDSCGTSDTLVTDAVIFEIIDSPVPLANLPIRAFPNPVGSVLSLNNINPADQWQSIELIGSDGHRFLIIKNIQNSTSINLNVAHIPPGLYYVIFKRSTGENAYLRIIKQ